MNDHEASGPCPSPEGLARLVTGELPDDERGDLLDHLAGCDACSREVRAVLPLGDWARESADELEPRRGLPAPRWWLRVAAIVLVVFGAGLWWSAVSDDPLAPTPGILRSGGPEATGPAPGKFTAAPERLEAPIAAVGSRFRFELVDADLEPAWTSQWVEATAVEIPAPVRERMVPGTSWLWRVTVDDGRRLEEGVWREIEIASRADGP